MALIQFSIRVTKLEKIPELRLTQQQTEKIGKTAIKELKNRVQQQHTSIYDTPMPPYSDKPIYVALGKSGGRAVITSGAVPIKSLNALRKAGARIVDARNTSAKLSKKIGKIRNAVINTGTSLRFENRTAYKRFLGQSGLRDLTETGAMLDALVITSITGDSAQVITIGFTDLVQERKAAGNMIYADWFGLSPSNELKITQLVESMIAKNLTKK